MVFYPDSINLTWIGEYNRSLSLDGRPQYNGYNLEKNILIKEAADIYDQCAVLYEQEDCIEIIYLIYHLTPIELDSVVFYDDGVFRYDQVRLAKLTIFKFGLGFKIFEV